nr:Fe-S cluster assembly protein SufB [Spiroplasma citri]
MPKLKQEKEIKEISSYKYGFNDGDISYYNTGKGLNETIINEISDHKNEPDWMREYRLQSYFNFLKIKNPSWGPNLEFMDFDEYIYYIKPTEHIATKWDEVPEKIKKTFDRLGLPEGEREYLAGIKAQYDSEPVYGSMLKEVEEKGIIFLDCDTALREHPELFKKYFGTLVPNTDNKYAALNGAVWSGGSFIYIPKGVKLEKPLQAYFRINYQNSGQFERTLIIVDDDAELHYIEGCTAPIYARDSLHAAIVEIF